jgi:hypothetical protein
MDLKSQLQIILQEAEYQTWLASVDGLDAVGFEDDTVMGFACIFPTAEALLQRWPAMEMTLLTSHAPSLQKAGEKTWNVYSVFLSAEKGDDVQARQVRWIEEDLERTRKIAAVGLVDREDLEMALLPVLPLQYQPVLDTEDFDLTRRLRKRIADIAPAVATAALDSEVSPAEVVHLLIGAET